MKRLIFIVFLFMFSITFCNAQSINGVDTALNGKMSDKFYKFKLRQPAQCIDKATFQKTGKPCNAYLSDDGMEVIIQNYIHGSTLFFEVTYRNGQKDVYVRNPCSLEMFIPL